MRRLCIIAALLIPAAAAAQQPKSGKTVPITAFYGEYVGDALTRVDGTGRALKKDRKSNVVVAPSGDGFKITWVTIRRRSLTGARRKTSFATLTFARGAAPNLWRARESKPLSQGGPLAIATLNGRTLMVHVLAMDKGGNLHTSTYARRLTRAGMSLRFRRALNGREQVRVSAVLRRVKK